MKFKTITAVMISGMLLFTGCSKEATKTDDSSGKQVAITIDDRKVYQDEAYLYLSQMEKRFEGVGGADVWLTDIEGKPAPQYAKDETIENIISTKMSVQKSKEFKISLNDQDSTTIEAQLKEYMANLTPEAKQYNVTEQLVKQVMGEDLLTQKVFEYVVKDFKIDEARVKKELDADTNYQQMLKMKPEDVLAKAKVKYIKVKTQKQNDKGESVDLTAEEKTKAKQKAEEALGKAKAGEDFAGLIKTYSEDELLAENKGETTVTKTNLNPTSLPQEFTDAAFKLKKGDISELIETPVGYFIIKVEEITQPTKEEIATTEEQIKSSIDYFKQQCENNQKMEFFQTKVAEWKKEVTIDINKKLWEEFKVGPEKK